MYFFTLQWTNGCWNRTRMRTSPRTLTTWKRMKRNAHGSVRNEDWHMSCQIKSWRCKEKKKNKPQQEETLHCWQRDPISYIQSKLVTYSYNNTNVLIPFFGKNTKKNYNIYFIGSSQMELNVFSLCTYGQLATNLGKKGQDIEPRYQYRDILET